jgi:DNA-binding NtrC family response regulator
MSQAEHNSVPYSNSHHETTQSSRMTSALIVDDEPGIRSFLQKGLEKRFSLVEVAGDADSAEALHQRCHFDLIIADIRLPGLSGVEWVTRLREQGSNTPVIFISAYADMQTAIEALRAGAADFILKPFRLEQLLASLDSCMERQRMQRENFVLRRQLGKYFHGSGIIGNCEIIKNVCELVKRIAPMPSTVLIEGESGTGKELVARAIHDYSHRKGSFVPINCGAVSAELLESELFGHVKGAFTGAHQAREGLFTYANGGTLFLDEIGEMPMTMQAHLLRVMEERTIRPVGSNREIPVDVRVIAATNRDLEAEVKKGNFREDLYYRLFVLAIRMPALRERIEDLSLLTQHFISTLSTEMGIPAINISEEEMAVMQQYDWPGNVRELKNLIERCLLLNTTPGECLAVQPAQQSDTTPVVENLQHLSLEEIEKRHILSVLQAESGNKSAAARRLGISRKTLERKVQSWEEALTA